MSMRFRATFDSARTMPAVLAFAIVAAGASAALGGDGYFQQTDGRVVMEVEHAPPAGDWNSETNHSGYTGNSFYSWRGPDLFEEPGHGILEYRFEIVDGGTHYLKIHSRRDMEGANEANDQCNDIWVRMDNGPWEKVFSDHLPWSDWNWTTKFDIHNVWPPATYNLSEGIHTMQISGRSEKFKIDRIQLTYNSNATPSTSTPESPWVGDGGNPDPAVAGLTLVDAGTDNDIRTLNNGATIDLQSDGDALNIRANPENAVGSMEFFLNGDSVKMESLAPFALGGDVGGDYDPYPFVTGSHTLTVVPYSGSNGSGTEGEHFTIDFNVVNGDACAADTDGNSMVDVEDLLTVLGEWGDCGATCNGDTNNDNVVDVEDLLHVLGDWGPCS